MVALEGQHTGWLTNASSKERPSLTSKEPISGICWAEAWSRSSASTKTKLGRSAEDSAPSSWELPGAEVSDPEQPTTRRRRIDRHTMTPKVVLILAPIDLTLWLTTVTKLPLCCRSALLQRLIC